MTSRKILSCLMVFLSFTSIDCQEDCPVFARCQSEFAKKTAQLQASDTTGICRVTAEFLSCINSNPETCSINLITDRSNLEIIVKQCLANGFLTTTRPETTTKSISPTCAKLEACATYLTALYKSDQDVTSICSQGKQYLQCVSEGLLECPQRKNSLQASVNYVESLMPQCKTSPGCNTKTMDIVLLVDTGPATAGDFNNVRNSIKAFLQNVPSLGGDTRVAVVPYASSAMATSALSSTSDLAALAMAVDTISPSPVFETRQSAALEYLATTPSLYRTGANKFAVVISPTAVAADDRNTVLTASATARQQGIQLYVQGYGLSHDLMFWEQATARINSRSVFLGALTRLDERLLEIIQLYCNVCADNTYVQNVQGYTGYQAACDQFYQCVLTDGKVIPHLMTCGPGTFWNNKIRRCDSMQAVSKDSTSGCGYTCNSVLSTKTYPSARSCAGYYQCNGLNIEQKCCEYGQRFNPAVGECVTDSTCLEICSDNVCNSDTSTASYQSRLGCSSYYQCEGFNRVRRCCASGQRFDAGSGQCVNDVSCTDFCSVESCQSRAVNGDECVYEVLDHGKYIQMACANGTAYVQSDCQCSKLTDACPPKTAQPKGMCHQEVGITFSPTTLQRTGRYWVETQTVNIGQLNSQSVGLFSGKTSMTMPYLRDNDFHLPRIIRIRYTEDSSANGEQLLFGNPCCGPSKLPSLVITHAANTRTVRIGARTSGKQMVYAQIQYGQQYDQSSWKEIVLGYDGLRITGQLRIYDTSSTNRLMLYTFPPLELGDHIAAVDADMTLGLGAVSQLTDYNVFKGAIQEMSIYQCNLPINLDDY